MNQNENEYVSLVRISHKWFNLFVWTFSIIIIAYTLIEFLFQWSWIKSLGGTALERIAILMTLIVGWFFILSHILEAIMLGYAKRYRDRIRAEAIEEVYEDAHKEVYEDAHKEGYEKMNRELQQAAKEGKTVEEFLETHNKKKNGKIDPSTTTDSTQDTKINNTIPDN